MYSLNACIGGTDSSEVAEILQNFKNSVTPPKKSPSSHSENLLNLLFHSHWFNSQLIPVKTEKLTTAVPMGALSLLSTR